NGEPGGALAAIDCAAVVAIERDAATYARHHFAVIFVVVLPNVIRHRSDRFAVDDELARRAVRAAAVHALEHHRPFRPLFSGDRELIHPGRAATAEIERASATGPNQTSLQVAATARNFGVRFGE